MLPLVVWTFQEILFPQGKCRIIMLATKCFGSACSQGQLEMHCIWIHGPEIARTIRSELSCIDIVGHQLGESLTGACLMWLVSIPVGCYGESILQFLVWPWQRFINLHGNGCCDHVEGVTLPAAILVFPPFLQPLWGSGLHPMREDMAAGVLGHTVVLYAWLLHICRRCLHLSCCWWMGLHAPMT